MAQSVMGKIEELSGSASGCWSGGRAPCRRGRPQAAQQIDHDLQVLWDLRRSELSGETIDLDDDFFDRFTVDPGADAPGR